MSQKHERGELEQTPLARLLMDLHAARFCGALRLSRGRVEKSFLLRKGTPFYADSNLASESLCARLLEGGDLSEADRDRVADLVKREECQEGTALLRLELVDSRTLFLALREQLRARMVECFGWPDGHFELDPEAPLAEGSEALAVDPYALVQEGIAGHWSPERVLKELGPRMALYPRATRGLARVAAHLGRDETCAALLASLDGEHSLWQVLQGAHTPWALAAAWVIDASGVLRYAEGPASDAGSESAPQIEILVRGSTAAEPQAPDAAEAAASSRPTPSLPPPSAQAAQLAAEIEERYAQLDDLDHYEVLGLDSQADAAALKKAYLQAARAYHPDVIARAGLDEGLRMRANKVFAEIAKAYALLSDPEKRRAYDASLELGGEEIDVERLASAEGLFRKGEVLVRQGNFRGALEFLEPAVELWPAEATYQGTLGWALYKKTPSEPERALEHLEQAVELDGDDSVLWFRLSVVLRALGDGEHSEKAMDRARALDPSLSA